MLHLSLPSCAFIDVCSFDHIVFVRVPMSLVYCHLRLHHIRILFVYVNLIGEFARRIENSRPTINDRDAMVSFVQQHHRVIH